MAVKQTQLEWLMYKLEPIEALELTAACTHIMNQEWPAPAACPICWLGEDAVDDMRVSTLLLNGLIWSETPQGKDYWQAVHDKYLALEAANQNHRKEE